MPENISNRDLQRDIGRMEAKIDSIHDVLQRYHEENTHCAADRTKMYERMNALENRQYWFSGAASMCGFILAKLFPHG